MDFMSLDFDLAENVFYFHNAELQSLDFVLDWDTKDKFYSNLLTMSFANVLEFPNDHSMVLARPGQTNYFDQKIPAFDIKYIEDIFNIKDYPDPTKYLIKNTGPGNYTKDDIFDCWLYRNKSWSDLISIPENKNNNWKIAVKLPSTNFISQATSSNEDFDGTLFSNRSPKASSSKNSNEDFDGTLFSNRSPKASSSKNSNEDFDGTLFSNRSPKASSSKNSNDDFDDAVLYNRPQMASSFKHTRMGYTHKEDVNIVKYIVKNNHALQIKGRAMWQQMERDNVCIYRTWQSMKERYLKFIKYCLTSGNQRFPFLTPTDLELLRKGLTNKDDREANIEYI